MSQTTCPHCGSKNHIETAGQIYCADCGQLIEGKASKEDAPKKAEAKPAAKAKPASKAIAHKAPAKAAKKTAPPLNLKVIENARTGQTKPQGPGVLDLKHMQAKKPATPTSAPEPTVVPVVSESAIVAEPNIFEDIQPTAPRKRFRHKNALRDGFRSVLVRKTIRSALAAGLLTTLTETIFVVLFAKSGMYAITESINAGSVNTARATTLIGHIGWAGLLGMVGYLIYHYVLAEIIFRTSRAFDRRSVTTAQTHRAGLGSLAGLFGLDVTTWILAILSGSLIIGANIGFLATKSLGVWGIVLAGITNILAIYVWLGLIAARHMATYAIVLGQVGMVRAYGTGWRLYNRQFGRVVSALIILAVVIALLSIPANATKLLVSGSIGMWLLYGITAVTQALVLIIGSVYFLRLYRFVVGREYDSDLGHLLTGRQPQQKHVAKRIVALVIIMIVWSAAMAYLIVNASSVAHALIR